MRHDARRALAGQALVAAEKAGLKVWQHPGAVYVARPVRGRLLPAPKHWHRLIVSLSFEIAELLDFDCGWGCTVERVPGGATPSSPHPKRNYLAAARSSPKIACFGVAAPTTQKRAVNLIIP